ncbi:MAG: hypothetical protein UY96_C0003G0057 [Parcubacteria group bacterium GW2011_GWB1_56_8]|nr:MAG: hypothetical protein UY96_C0003G0057 [Parcubacteria group bacterium GW2011_GWB1_56_8]
MPKTAKTEQNQDQDQDFDLSDEQVATLGKLEQAKELAQKFWDRTEVTADEVRLLFEEVVLLDNEDEEDDE